MPDRILEVIDGTDRWWPPVKQVRDILTHREHQKIAFGGAGSGVLFQLYVPGSPGLQPRVIDPHFLWKGGNNVADFRLYSASVVAELLVFLDELGAVLADILGLSIAGHQRSTRVGDFAYLIEPMEQLLRDEGKP
jgi:hypothetical protein